MKISSLSIIVNVGHYRCADAKLGVARYQLFVLLFVRDGTHQQFRFSGERLVQSVFYLDVRRGLKVVYIPPPITISAKRGTNITKPRITPRNTAIRMWFLDFP